MRPVVLFCKKREEFLREKSKDLQAQPQEQSGLPNYMKSTQMSRVKTCPRTVIQDIVPETEEAGSDMATQTASVPNGMAFPHRQQ
ncbi:hypothetical protein SKAU_G00040990 [Synaphobranchus kaupii]|uniref:Uncharacterized protein n=1 Tax=Synaphobranchus kaupii TaxID=118154 RepID=A0A9Q1G162_SYNKA|nr:hypothetical protein SKAU_G00040990 [Synaphobranchus kaupii]